MSRGVNRWVGIGNLGKDPEVRYTRDGLAVCNLRIACQESVKSRWSESYEQHTEWINIVCFGKTAENAGQYLAKGRQVYVEGTLRTKKYRDKSGIDRWWTEVVARRVVFLVDRAHDYGLAPQPTNVEEPETTRSTADDGFIDDDDDDDLPF